MMLPFVMWSPAGCDDGSPKKKQIKHAAYGFRLVPLADPCALLEDHPKFVSPLHPQKCFKAPPLIKDGNGTLVVKAWRYSYNARGVIIVPNYLDPRRTAVVVIHPWGIDDQQGWKTPRPAGVAFLCTPDKNNIYKIHLKKIVNPFVNKMRSIVDQVVITLPGPPDNIRSKLYCTLAGCPTLTEERKARAALLKRLKRFKYQGASLPSRLALRMDKPLAWSFFKAFGSLMSGPPYNPKGFWKLPIPVSFEFSMGPKDVVYYDRQGYDKIRKYLKDKGIKNILMCGYTIEKCVKGTSAGYLNLRKDFNVFIVADATLANFPANSSPAMATSVAAAVASKTVFITQISWISELKKRQQISR